MKCYHVDAFADKIFEGNPAVVCVMDSWPDDGTMQSLAIENNLSETAFTVKEGDVYRLRWFTPGGEIDLCGHATLATAFVLTNFYEKDCDVIVFETLSGQLTVKKSGDLFEMDFPAYDLRQVEVTDEMEEAIGFRPIEAWMGRDLVCVTDDEKKIIEAAPDQNKVAALDGLILHITSRGSEYDCMTRTFCPKMNIVEDPVCGSGHCHVAPLWANKLGKSSLVARQASKRGGTLFCTMEGGRVRLSGKAVLYSINDVML